MFLMGVYYNGELMKIYKAPTRYPAGLGINTLWTDPVWKKIRAIGVTKEIISEKDLPPEYHPFLIGLDPLLDNFISKKGKTK